MSRRTGGRARIRAGVATLVWLVAGLAGMGVPARAADWPATRTSGNVVYRADFKLDGLETRFTELGELQRELQRTLAIPAPREMVEVYLFATQAAYAQHLQNLLGHAPDRRALYIKSGGRGRVYVYWSKEIAVDLRHECTHAFLHAALPDVPLWLDEGLAEYFEIPAAERAFDNPHLSFLFKTTVAWGHVPPLATLELRQDLDEITPDDYRQAWAWVHFMFHGPRAGHEEMVRYLADLAEHRPVDPLSQRLKARMPDLDQQFIKHFKRWQQK